MLPSTILTLVLQYGPGVVDLIGKLVALKNAGDKPLAAADFELLNTYAAKTSADYLKEA